jgi:hypothetical protein
MKNTRLLLVVKRRAMAVLASRDNGKSDGLSLEGGLNAPPHIDAAEFCEKRPSCEGTNRCSKFLDVRICVIKSLFERLDVSDREIKSV